MAYVWFLLPFLGAHALLLPTKDVTPATGQWYREEMHNPFGGMLYLSKIQAGGQDVYGIFDTGSFDVVVPGTDCGEPCRPDTVKLGVNFSAYTPHHEEGVEPELTYKCYGSGCLVVEVADDIISVAGGQNSASGPLSVIVEAGANMAMNETGGIFGSGPCFGDRADCKSVQAITGVDRYSVCFSQDRAYGSGFLIWNDIDRCEGTDAHQITMDTSLGEWATRMQSISLTSAGANVFSFGCQGSLSDQNSGCYTVLDTGTSLTTLPNGPVTALLEYLNVDRWTGQVTCQEAFNDFPDLSFFMGDTQYTLNPMSYVWQSDMFPGGEEWKELQSLLAVPLLPMDARGATALRRHRQRQTEGTTGGDLDPEENVKAPVCFFMVDDSSQYYNEENLAILGMGFFAEYYSTFENKDQEDPRVCISRAPDDCAVTAEHLTMPRPVARTRAKVTNVAESVPKIDAGLLLKQLRHSHKRHEIRARHFREQRLRAAQA